MNPTPATPPVYKVDVDVTVSKFNRTNGKIGNHAAANIQATLGNLTYASPKGGPEITLGPSPKDLNNQLLRIDFSKCDPRPQIGTKLVLRFNLKSEDYTMLGIAFAPPTTVAPSKVGRTEFPELAIVRTEKESKLTITDECLKTRSRKNYAFGILIQEVASGDFGIFDPDIETTGLN